jgi:predicted nuclease of predicted toxin-antitoxin system
MIRLLADNNAGGHVAILVRIFLSEAWLQFWNDLKLTTITFEDLGLDRSANDAELWRVCQREQVVLITNNRNADDPDSLEMTIRRENRADSLPVFTIADPDRIGVDRAYAERTAISLLEYLLALDDARGMGRIFIP